MGLVTFTRTLAIEGAKYNIKASVIAPMAASPMTETIMPPEMLAGLKVRSHYSPPIIHSLTIFPQPEFVAPLVLALTHPEGPEASGKCFEVGAGFVAEVRWERTQGAVFKTDESFTPSAVKARWGQVTDWTNAEHPESMGSVDMAVSCSY